VGKTSTKDAIYTVLKKTTTVRRSEKSFNSELGVPLSIIGAQNAWNSPIGWLRVMASGVRQMFAKKGTFPKVLVLEVGADRPGDISTIAAWLKPHVVVLTRLPDVPVHIEFFPTVESLVAEKLSLARGARKEATIILNADDPRIIASKPTLPFRTVTFGTTGDHTTLRASNVQILPVSEMSAGGLNFKLDFDGKSFPVNLPNIYTEGFLSVALASLGVAYAMKMSMLEAIDALAEYQTPPGRAHLLPGAGETIIIDDTYNSSPIAAEAGLTMLRDLPFGKRKVAVVADMLELGKHTVEAHRKIGTYAKKCAMVLVAVGVRSKETAAAAREAGMKKVFEADDALAAIDVLEHVVRPGDVLFIKGSQGMRMERVVKHFMAEPERAGELLVRQDTAWEKK
jgi:UDP-N-acetylmuramoyl-tripeptide--D-alanyl-D-alanine ligase